MSSEVVLLLGSNRGRRVKRIREAIRELARGFDVARVSRIYASEPGGRANQPWFLNQAVAGTTGLSPDGLLSLAKEVEAKGGRRAGPRWGPREIDIDIVLWGGLVVAEPHLAVPHPALAERRFCLVPVAEIAPDASVPPGNRTVRELLERCSDRKEVQPL